MIIDKLDIVLLTTPVFNFKLPNPSIYQLKGTLNLYGFKSRCFDLTQESVKYFGDSYTEVNKCLLEHYYETREYDEQIREFYNKFVRKKIKPLAPRWVGVNVHSIYNHKSAAFLTNIIRDIMPEVKIIIGGDGYKDKTMDESIFNNSIKSDFFILGDGELALVKLLKTGKHQDCIREQNINLDYLPFPDYSDYYKDFGNLDRVAITGSKGCCNNCNYCSIKYYHKVFRQRSAKNIYNEMLHQCRLYNTKYFQFSDSIINGNIKVFRELLTYIIELRKEFKISYGGYFGVNENFVENDFKLMKESNILHPWIGVESISEKVRDDMNKRYSNEALYFTIDNLLKYNIKPVLLFLIGYPTETEEDFQQNVDFLNHYKKYSDRILLRFGETYHIRKGTPTEKFNIYEWEMSGNIAFWKSTVVSNLDFPERVRRRKLLSKVAKDLGYILTSEESDNIKYLNTKLNFYLSKKDI